jgi:pseudomonalisin
MPSFRAAALSLATLFLAVLATLVLPSQSFAAPPAGTTSLQGQRPQWALAENSRGAVPGDTMLEHLTLVLQRSPQRQQAFERFLRQLQDRSSGNYHHFLSPTQLGQKFGVPESDIDAITGWLTAQGLRVDSVSNSRMMIDFSGTASMIGAAFGTQMLYYEVNGEQRIANANDPQIPAAFAGVIQSINGLHTLNNRSYHGTGKASKREGPSPQATFCNPACSNFIFPADFATIYDLNGLSVDGTGQNIGIIGRSRVYGPDIQNFQNLSGLTVNPSTPTVIIPPSGVDPGPADGTTDPAPGDQVEATLDVMRSSSIAPGATIDLIVSASTQTEDGIDIAAQYAVDHSPVPAQVMSISFGLCEADVVQSDVTFWDNLFSQAVGEGISVFVSSGDSGAAGCDNSFQTPPAHQTLSTNYICASSFSTCVGGTEFADSADPSLYWNQNADQEPPFESALGPIPEGGWNEPFQIGSSSTEAAASGGGFSVFIPTPSWQVGTGVPGTQGRYTPDVAFSSSGHDGYFGCLAADGASCVVSGGGFNFEFFFGTSAAAPDMAGITALLNQSQASPQGELNQRLYQLAATPANLVFNDVTVATSAVSGCSVATPSMCNNSTPSPTGLTGGLAGYLVTAGYDEVTGLGSINGANLLASWAVVSLPPTTTTVVSSENPSNFGDSVTFTATVTPTGASTPTGIVTFKNGSTTLGTGTLGCLCNGIVGSAAATSYTTTSTQLPPGSDSITAAYAGDSNNAGSTSTVLTQVVNPPTFSLSNPTAPATILSGESTTSTFTVTPTSGGSFVAAVNLSCTGLPDATVTCNFSTNPIPAGTVGAVNETLTINTTGPNSSGLLRNGRRHADNRLPWVPLTLPLAGVVMAGVAGRKRSRYSMVASLSAALILIGLLLACGGSSTPPPVGVSVSPSASTVFPNDSTDGWPPQTASFTATVSNSTNTAVTWSLSSVVSCSANPSPCGTIDSTGAYTAPTIVAGLPSSITATATSQADSTKTGSARITLTPTTVPGSYPLSIQATESTTVNTKPITLNVN